MEYAPEMTFNLKTGKWETKIIDDRWVLENTRLVSIVAEKTTITADGEDGTPVIVMMTSNWLVSVEQKRTIAEDVTITLIADGVRHNVALVAGMGVVTVKAVEVGSYEITVDGIHCEPLTIVAEEAKAESAAKAKADAVEGETVIVLGKRQLAEKASRLSDETFKLLTSTEFHNKTDREKINLLWEYVVHLAHIQRGKG